MKTTSRMSPGGPGRAQGIGFGQGQLSGSSALLGEGVRPSTVVPVWPESPVSAGLAALESDLYGLYPKPQEGTTPLANPKTPRKRSLQDSKIPAAGEGLGAGGVCSARGGASIWTGSHSGSGSTRRARLAPGGFSLGHIVGGVTVSFRLRRSSEAKCEPSQGAQGTRT